MSRRDDLQALHDAVKAGTEVGDFCGIKIVANPAIKAGYVAMVSTVDAVVLCPDGVVRNLDEVAALIAQKDAKSGGPTT